MPQLDVAAFLTNFFWLVVVFFTLYVLVLKIFLPRLAKSFIFRTELVSQTFESSIRSRLLVDYYGASFQFLESALAYSLVDSTLHSFRECVEFQNSYLLYDISELLETESTTEASNDLDDIG
jgi:hypothetical protein